MPFSATSTEFCLCSVFCLRMCPPPPPPWAVLSSIAATLCRLGGFASPKSPKAVTGDFSECCRLIGVDEPPPGEGVEAVLRTNPSANKFVLHFYNCFSFC